MSEPIRELYIEAEFLYIEADFASMYSSLILPQCTEIRPQCTDFSKADRFQIDQMCHKSLISCSRRDSVIYPIALGVSDSLFMWEEGGGGMGDFHEASV